VKQISTILLTFLTIPSLLLGAPDIDTEDMGSVQLPPPEAQKSSEEPYYFEVFGDYVNRAKVRDCPYYGHVQYSTTYANLNRVVYYNPCYEEGFGVGLSYQWNHLKLEHNPFFSQQNINTVSLSLSAFTKRACNWKWDMQLTLNFDNVEYWNYKQYMNYDLVVWGRYTLYENVGVHLGLIGQTGMKMDRAYPIFGFDWKINENWVLNLVFPLNIAAIYNINPQWSVSLAGRFFDQRHRVNKNDALSRALWRYQASGAELAINYSPDKWISANIHAGSTLGGLLKIANQHYDGPRLRLKLNPAPYAGAQIIMTF